MADVSSLVEMIFQEFRSRPIEVTIILFSIFTTIKRKLFNPKIDKDLLLKAGISPLLINSFMPKINTKKLPVVKERDKYIGWFFSLFYLIPIPFLFYIAFNLIITPNNSTLIIWKPTDETFIANERYIKK